MQDRRAQHFEQFQQFNAHEKTARIFVVKAVLSKFEQKGMAECTQAIADCIDPNEDGVRSLYVWTNEIQEPSMSVLCTAREGHTREEWGTMLTGIFATKCNMTLYRSKIVTDDASITDVFARHVVTKQETSFVSSHWSLPGFQQQPGGPGGSAGTANGALSPIPPALEAVYAAGGSPRYPSLSPERSGGPDREASALPYPGWVPSSSLSYAPTSPTPTSSGAPGLEATAPQVVALGEREDTPQYSPASPSPPSSREATAPLVVALGEREDTPQYSPASPPPTSSGGPVCESTAPLTLALGERGKSPQYSPASMLTDCITFHTMSKNVITLEEVVAAIETLRSRENAEIKIEYACVLSAAATDEQDKRPQPYVCGMIVTRSKIPLKDIVHFCTQSIGEVATVCQRNSKMSLRAVVLERPDRHEIGEWNDKWSLSHQQKRSGSATADDDPEERRDFMFMHKHYVFEEETAWRRTIAGKFKSQKVLDTTVQTRFGPLIMNSSDDVFTCIQKGYNDKIFAFATFCRVKLGEGGKHSHTRAFIVTKNGMTRTAFSKMFDYGVIQADLSNEYTADDDACVAYARGQGLGLYVSDDVECKEDFAADGGQNPADEMEQETGFVSYGNIPRDLLQVQTGAASNAQDVHIPVLASSVPLPTILQLPDDIQNSLHDAPGTSLLVWSRKNKVREDDIQLEPSKRAKANDSEMYSTVGIDAH